MLRILRELAACVARRVGFEVILAVVGAALIRTRRTFVRQSSWLSVLHKRMRPSSSSQQTVQGSERSPVGSPTRNHTHQHPFQYSIEQLHIFSHF